MAAVRAGKPVNEVAARVGVSRTTIYKWLDRARASAGRTDYNDRSRSPRNPAHQLRHEVLSAIRDIAAEQPLWGATEVHRELRSRVGADRTPDRSTVSRRLKDERWAASLGAFELHCLCPPRGNLSVLKRQFWIGPAYGGKPVVLWLSPSHVQIFIYVEFAKYSEVRFSADQLERLRQDGRARPAKRPPLPVPDREGVVDRVRLVSRDGSVSLGGRSIYGLNSHRGRHVVVRFRASGMTFHDPETGAEVGAGTKPRLTVDASSLRPGRWVKHPTRR